MITSISRFKHDFIANDRSNKLNAILKDRSCGSKSVHDSIASVVRQTSYSSLYNEEDALNLSSIIFIYVKLLRRRRTLYTITYSLVVHVFKNNCNDTLFITIARNNLLNIKQYEKSTLLHSLIIIIYII